MSARAFDHELRVHESFFCDTDQGAGLLDAGEDSLDNRAAFVQHQRGHDAARAHGLDDDGLGFARNFLISSEGEIHVVFRHEPALEQVLRGFHHAQQGTLCVQRTATPEDAVLNQSVERGLCPEFLVDRHHVIMRHEHGGIFRAFALE